MISTQVMGIKSVQSGPKHTNVKVSNRHRDRSRLDAVTVEEPLEIWVAYRDKSGEMEEFSLSITMRTPGSGRWPADAGTTKRW